MQRPFLLAARACFTCGRSLVLLGRIGNCTFRFDQCVLIHLLLGHDLNEECYPYEAEDLKCRYEKSCEYTKGVVTDQVYSYGTNEEELKTMVVEYGPVVTGLDATALQFYDSGILDDFMCCDAADDFECVYVFYTIF